VSQLKTYNLPDLIAVNFTTGAQGGLPWKMLNTIEPGEPVRHKDDPNSYGMCLSRRWGPDDKPMQIDVLWSKQPDILDIQVQQITATTRKLRAKWSAEIIEEKFYSDMASGELEALNNEPGVKDVIFQHDVAYGGDTKVTIKRVNPEPDPDESIYVPGLNGQVKFRR